VLALISVALFQGFAAADESINSSLPNAEVEYSPENTSAEAHLVMGSNIPRGSGVEIPAGVTLVGNLAIQYQYGMGDLNWDYVSANELRIENLGTEVGNLRLRALYYGNESSDYTCIVTFSTDGWERMLMPDEVKEDLTDADRLAINFTDLNTSVVEDSGIVSTASADNNGFSLMVPVSAPINGEPVAEITAQWLQKDLPAGEYAAEIEIAVTSP